MSGGDENSYRGLMTLSFWICWRSRPGGCRVCGCSGVQRQCEALEALDREGRWTWRSTDMSMPGMDGLQLTREILSGRPRSRCSLTGPMMTAQLSRRALESGVRRCLVKDEGLMDGIAECG